MIAGRVLRATRALLRRPRATENFQNDGLTLRKEVFDPQGRSPKLHSGPSAQRIVPYQNGTHNQQPHKKQQSHGEGKHGIVEKLTIKTPSDVLATSTLPRTRSRPTRTREALARPHQNRLRVSRSLVRRFVVGRFRTNHLCRDNPSINLECDESI
jgi:hypothetical protein